MPKNRLPEKHLNEVGFAYELLHSNLQRLKEMHCSSFNTIMPDLIENFFIVSYNNVYLFAMLDSIRMELSEHGFNIKNHSFTSPPNKEKVINIISKYVNKLSRVLENNI